ncbi:MAG: leucine-rich repeat domain-containing protein [Candidatus Latescibacteria bacterium]|nr:leucine-rich repeat domain-containing protein [Candidatus Latescibacterota bacterium]
MRNIVLSILSILALLMYPLSLSAQNSFSLSLDVDDTAGDQAVRSLDISADQVVAIQIFGTGIQNANGLAVRFEYDAAQVVYEDFDVGDVLPNAQALPEHGTGFVEIGIASLGGQATANSGLVGAVRFRTTAAFSGTTIRLVRADLSRSGQFESATMDVRVELNLQDRTSDFDGDGQVGFSDFLAFAGQFGSRQGDGRYEAKYDLDSDGAIGFGDFLLFSSSFGKETDGGGTETQVTIPDENLRAAIESALRKTRGASISRAEMASLTRLEAPDLDVRDLTGLEFATGLTSLILSDNIISDLTPLSGLINLSVLNLPDNSISDLTPLLGLTNLTSLILSDNIISDLTPLLGLTNLTSLILSGNLFSDISPLSGLTNLTSLNLSYNSISDISPLSSLTNLSVLILYDDTIIRSRSVLSRLSNLSEADIPDANLRAAIKIAMGKASDDPLTDFEMAFFPELEVPNSNIRDLTGLELAMSLTSLDLGTELVSGEGYVNSNHISDFSPLSGLTNLTRLDLGGNSISDLSVLSGIISRLTNLERLYLDNNSISDVSTLSGLTNLGLLNLDNNNISDISALSGLTNLISLYLRNNNISDVSTLSGLTNLLQLFLRGNNISDISALSDLTRLISLYLRNNSISDITPLSGLTRMRTLYLDNNRISNITPLSGLTRMTRLDLDNNSISDLSPLSGLTNLEGLGLSDNSISDVSALSGLTNLEGLGLSDNSISDVSALSGLTSLIGLYIRNNSISDLAPLVANTGLGTGDVVDIRNNPLSDTSINTHIPALQSRRVEVRFGALKPAVEKKERDIFREMMELLESDERRN